MSEVWCVLTEIDVPRDTTDSGESVVGFTNWITKAEDGPNALRKVQRAISSYGWMLLDHETPYVITLENCADEELAELISRAEGSAEYVLYGTVHTYKPS